jgi:hypothetical protein
MAKKQAVQAQTSVQTADILASMTPERLNKLLALAEAEEQGQLDVHASRPAVLFSWEQHRDAITVEDGKNVPIRILQAEFRVLDLDAETLLGTPCGYRQCVVEKETFGSKSSVTRSACWIRVPESPDAPLNREDHLVAFIPKEFVIG